MGARPEELGRRMGRAAQVEKEGKVAGGNYVNKYPQEGTLLAGLED